MFHLLQLTLILFQITLTHSYVQLTAFITADDWIISDGNYFRINSVTSTSGSTIDGSKWNINVENQKKFDLHISLHNSWGFHPSFPSTISLIINGSTPNNTLHNNGDVLFLFAVDYNQYFTALTHLDTSQRPFEIYPSNQQPLASADIKEMMTNPELESPRITRYTQNNSWSIAQTASNTSFTHAAIWPMYINITNDPIQNTVTYQWNDAVNPQIITVRYNTSFDVNKGLDIYLAGNNTNEPFTIYSVGISNHIIYEPTTTIPTVATTETATTAQTTETTTTTPTPETTTDNPTITPTNTPIIYTTFMNTTSIMDNTNAINTTFDALTTRSLFTSTLETIINTLLSATERGRFMNATQNRIQSTEAVTTTQKAEGEVFEKTSTPLKETVYIEATLYRSLVINLDSVLGYLLISGVLIFGIICCVCGICIGITFYKRKLNMNDRYNNDNDSNKSDNNILSELEKQIANSIRNKINIDINETEDTDRHESLYGDNESSTKGPQILDRASNTADGESAIIDILIHPHDDIDRQLQDLSQKEHAIANNDIDVYIENIVNERYEIVSATHKLAINDQILDIGNRSNVDNVSVNYANNDDEKENRLFNTRTPGDEQQETVKKYGIIQQHIFPNDEGSEIQKYIDIESVHEKSVEIELQQRNEAQQKKEDDKREENEEYFKFMEKIMLDEGSSVGDTEAQDVIAPLPGLQEIHMHKLNVNSVFILNKKRKSLSHSYHSQTIYSHKTGHSFESLIDDEKQIEIIDDEGYNCQDLEDDVDDMTNNE